MLQLIADLFDKLNPGEELNLRVYREGKAGEKPRHMGIRQVITIDPEKSDNKPQL